MAGQRAIEAGRALVKLELGHKQFSFGLNAASRKLKAFGTSVAGIGLKLAGIGVAAGAAFIPAVKAASRMEETMAKFNVVFANSSTTIRRWSDDLAKEVGRSKQQIADFMASTQDLFVPMGFDPTKATQISKILTKLAIDLASFNNKADADVMRDLHAAMTGSGEVMKKYGVLLSETAIKQELMNQGMSKKAAAAASEQEKAIARLNIIMRGTTAAQGDAVRSGAAFANQVKRLKGVLDDTFVTIGEALLPMLARFAKKVSEVIERVGEWINKNEALFLALAKGIAVVVAVGVSLTLLGGVFQAVGVALGVVGFAIGSVIGAIGLMLTPLGLVAAGFAVVIAATFGFANVLAGMASIGHTALDNLASIMHGTFDGIKDALAAGDWQLAAEIGWAGIKAAFVSGTSSLRAYWAGFYGWWQSQILTMGTWLKKAWNNDMSTMKEGWAVTKGLFTGKSREDMRKEVQAIRDETNEWNDVLDSINDAGQELLLAEENEELRKIRKAEKDARAELERLRKEASTKREEVEAAQEGKKEKLADDLNKLLADLQKQLEVGVGDIPGVDNLAKSLTKLNVSAVSSAAAIRLSAQMARRVDEEIAEATKKTADGVDKLVKIMKRPGQANPVMVFQ